MAKKPASRAERYQRLCREAAKLLGAKASDDRCAHYATLKLAREAAAAKLIAGQDVDPAGTCQALPTAGGARSRASWAKPPDEIR